MYWGTQHHLPCRAVRFAERVSSPLSSRCIRASLARLQAAIHRSFARLREAEAERLDVFMRREATYLGTAKD